MEKYIQLSKIKPESITNTTQEKGEKCNSLHTTPSIMTTYLTPVILIVQCANQIIPEAIKNRPTEPSYLMAYLIRQPVAKPAAWQLNYVCYMTETLITQRVLRLLAGLDGEDGFFLAKSTRSLKRASSGLGWRDAVDTDALFPFSVFL